ncbi:molybdopterin synthase catalytic subunit [Methylococcales bacterium]|nr:molybdopterin synthase catalytic subunit [Methylococcales bacterium]
MAVMIRETAFFPYRELDAYQEQSSKNTGKFGATAVFVGTMRDFNLGTSVNRMVLEYYPGMTEIRLEKIVEDAHGRWGFIDSLVIHRVGEINRGDAIVLVAVWTSHRAEAFEACRYIIETLKHSAPFWKKETLQDGERWVDRNT